MKIIAICLALLIGKAGVALPISYADMLDLKSRVDNTEMPESLSTNCCGQDNDDSDGCCGSGICGCIAIGGLTMTTVDMINSHDIDLYHQTSIFSFSFLYQQRFTGSVFEPPKA